MKASLLVLALAVFLPIPGATPPAKMEAGLGPVTVGEYQGQVRFAHPADDGKSYRIDVIVSKPVHTSPIIAERIDVWLLARNGKAVPVRERPKAGPLVESILGRGAAADAIFLFSPSVAYAELSGVVVSVDGKLAAFKVPA